MVSVKHYLFIAPALSRSWQFHFKRNYELTRINPGLDSIVTCYYLYDITFIGIW